MGRARAPASPGCRCTNQSASADASGRNPSDASSAATASSGGGASGGASSAPGNGAGSALASPSRSRASRPYQPMESSSVTRRYSGGGGFRAFRRAPASRGPARAPRRKTAVAANSANRSGASRRWSCQESHASVQRASEELGPARFLASGIELRRACLRFPASVSSRALKSALSSASGRAGNFFATAAAIRSASASDPAPCPIPGEQHPGRRGHARAAVLPGLLERTARHRCGARRRPSARAWSRSASARSSPASIPAATSACATAAAGCPAVSSRDARSSRSRPRRLRQRDPAGRVASRGRSPPRGARDDEARTPQRLRRVRGRDRAGRGGLARHPTPATPPRPAAGRASRPPGPRPARRQANSPAARSASARRAEARSATGPSTAAAARSGRNRVRRDPARRSASPSTNRAYGSKRPRLAAVVERPPPLRVLRLRNQCAREHQQASRVGARASQWRSASAALPAASRAPAWTAASGTADAGSARGRWSRAASTRKESKSRGFTCPLAGEVVSCTHSRALRYPEVAELDAFCYMPAPS